MTIFLIGGCVNLHPRLRNDTQQESQFPSSLPKKFKTKMNFETKCDLLRKMIESLQCSRCKAVPGFEKESKNRYQCLKKSAIFCEKCKTDCDSKFPSTVVQKLLEDMPCFCPNFKDGCQEIFSECGDLNEHKNWCMFRPLTCVLTQYGTCEKKVLFKDYMEHIKEHVPRKGEIDNSSKNQLIANFDLCNKDENEIDENPGTWVPIAYQGVNIIAYKIVISSIYLVFFRFE